MREINRSLPVVWQKNQPDENAVDSFNGMITQVRPTKPRSLPRAAKLGSRPSVTGLSANDCIRYAVLTLPALVAAAALLMIPGPLLRAAAAWWVVSDRIAPSDAVLVLGGGYDRRPLAAAALYRHGLAKQVLIAQVAQPSLTAPSESRRSQSVLIAAGVPAAAIAPFGNNVTSTYEEARAAALWAAEHGVRRLIIPTDWYHTRRVRWIFRALAQPEIEVSVMALPGAEADLLLKGWSGLKTLARESVKYCYYRIRYALANKIGSGQLPA